MAASSQSSFADTTFDYLIVGGGTAGLALAARLSEDPNIVVGVIEAGEYDPNVPEINTPGMCGRIIANPKYDWSFMSVPQTRANNRPVFQPRGKALGGSSMLNLLGMLRASKEEYDSLEELGNKGWNWESLLTFMKKSETLIPPSPDDAAKYFAKPDLAFHGTDGPIISAFPAYWNDMHLSMFETLQALGVPINPESGNGRNIGAISSLASVDPRTATRSYAASGYYAPNASRKNLHLLTGAQVTKVLLAAGEGGVKKAVGVEFIKGEQKTTVKNVRKDIVLAAGAFQTPQLLELSGIGNKEILGKHGIETVVDLPGVGENLQDHVCVHSIVEIDSKYETLDILFDPAGQAKHGELYKEKKGMLSSVLAAALAFVPSNQFGTDAEVKDWQSQVDANVDSHTLPGLKKQHVLQQRWFADPQQAQAELLQFPGHFPAPGHTPTPGKRYMSFVSALLHPLSRGTVHIASADPLAPPAIDPNYFSNPLDLELLTHILKYTLKVYGTEPFKGAVRAPVMPGADVLQGGDAALREYVKQWCGPVYHPVGTAAMMPMEDGGVVDAELKVYGTSNLRVVDVSIVPMEMSCHTQSIAYAIGEKAANIFRGV